MKPVDTLPRLSLDTPPPLVLEDIERETVLAYARAVELLAYTEQKIPLLPVPIPYVDGYTIVTTTVAIPSLGQIEYTIRIEGRGEEEWQEAQVLVHTHPMVRVHAQFYDRATDSWRGKLDLKSWSVLKNAITRISSQALTT